MDGSGIDRRQDREKKREREQPVIPLTNFPVDARVYLTFYPINKRLETRFFLLHASRQSWFKEERERKRDKGKPWQRSQLLLSFAARRR